MLAPIFEIHDPDDPRIADFRDVRERDLVGRGGLIAEGAVVLDQLLASSRFRATALLILRNRMAGLASRLGQLDPEVPVFVAERPVLDRIAGFPVHRGVLAHAEQRDVRRASFPELEAVARAGGIVVVAAGIANHDNMGAIFRNAAAFGAAAVLIDERSCDPLYRKAIRVSVGTVLRLPFFRTGAVQETASQLRGLGFRNLALSPGGDVALEEVTGIGATALFLGAEGMGLPVRLMSEMETVRIEVGDEVDSLNVAAAAAITLHHLAVLRRRDPPAALAATFPIRDP